MMDYIVKIADIDSSAIVDDVFEIICLKNRTHLESTNSYQYFLSKKLPEIVFNLSKLFKLAPEARYFAVELFHAFSNKYIQKYCQRKDKMIAFCSNSALYILVCIQISSKMSSHYKAISQRNVINQMNLANGQRRVSKADVIGAELEILQLVNYDLNFLLPLEIIDVLLYFVQNFLKEENQTGLKNCSKLKETCSCILEMVYLRQHHILTSFYGSSGQQACDQVLLSIAVICVAVFIVDDNLSEDIAVFLSKKCNADQSKVLKMSVCVTENVYKNKD